MSDYTTTPNLGLYKPTYNADDDQWGLHINSNADVLDAAVFNAGMASTMLPLMDAAAAWTVAVISRRADATAPTYNGALTGGGSVMVPVLCDGTAWKAH